MLTLLLLSRQKRGTIDQKNLCNVLMVLYVRMITITVVSLDRSNIEDNSIEENLDEADLLENSFEKIFCKPLGGRGTKCLEGP